MKTRVNYAILGLLICVSGMRAEDWPTYQHDVRRSAYSSQRLAIDTLKEVWVHRSPQPPQPAWAGPARWDAYAGLRNLRSMRNYDPVFHPIIVGTALYYGSSADGAVHCLDNETGHERWYFLTDGPVRIPPTYAEGRLYFGSDDGYAYCITADEGRLIWKYRPEVTSDLVLANGRLISFWPCRTGVMVDRGTATFAMGMLPWKPSYLCAVDARTGEVTGTGRFVRQLEGVTFEGALLASSGRLISPQGRVPPLLFERVDGRPLGSLEGGGGSFVLLTEDAHVLHGPGNKAGWIQESGAEDRSKIATFNGGNAVVVVGDTSYLLTDRALVALDRKRRREIWNAPLDCPYALIAMGDHLVAGGTDKLVVVRAQTGEVAWEATVEGRVYGLAAGADGLFASTDTGALYCFRPGPAVSAEHRATPRREMSGKTTAEAEAVASLNPVERVEEPGLVGRWVFQRPWVQGRSVRNLAGGTRARLESLPEFTRLEAQEVLEFDGSVQDALIAEDTGSEDLPRTNLTAEAWVRVDQPLSWGGIVGCIQDNGDFERGWLLGYVDSRFALGVVGKEGPGRMTYLKADQDFELGQWCHVLGSYDGERMRLYVDGRLAGESTVQRGAIWYPPNGVYVMGSYRDEDEHYRLTGALREVRVYGRALKREQAAQHAKVFRPKVARPEMRPTFELAAGPCLRFEGLDRAVVWWETDSLSPTQLEYGLEEEREGWMTVEDALPKRRHEVLLQVPKRNRMYQYRIGGGPGEVGVWSDDYECDTFFNFNLPGRLQGGRPGISDVERAELILQQAGIEQGLALVMGADDPELVLALVAASRLRVVVIDTDAEAIRRVRERFMSSGLYGVRVSAHWVKSYASRSLPPAFANLILARANQALGSSADRERVAWIRYCLRPYGGVALVVGVGQENAVLWRSALADGGEYRVTSTGEGLRVERGELAGAGEWTHQYGTASAAGYGGESLQGACGTEDLEVQWLGRPGPRAQPDRNGRKPAPLAAKGRLFVQGLHRVIALDAFNGTVLWSREIPSLQRFNLPRDSGNWCTDGDSVFLAVGDRCWRLSAASGELERMDPVVAGDRTGWAYEWGYLSVQGERVVGSATKRGSAFVDFWGGADAGWYDATSGPATHKVCSEKLFVLGRGQGECRWEYGKGLILNSTIAMDERRVFFLENRNSEVVQGAFTRVGGDALWRGLHLVALDVQTGQEIWERPINPAPGIVVVYLAYSDGRLVLVTSGAGRYYAACYEDQEGEEQWVAEFGWPKDNHGGHMARPAIVNSRVFVRPRVLSLADGEAIGPSIPVGGCGTYAAIDGALVFRNSNVTLWGIEDGQVSSWNRLRPDCWLSTIPATGLLLAPEAGGGCSCGSWLETSVVFRPRGLSARRD